MSDAENALALLSGLPPGTYMVDIAEGDLGTGVPLKCEGGRYGPVENRWISLWRAPSKLQDDAETRFIKAWARGEVRRVSDGKNALDLPD